MEKNKFFVIVYEPNSKKFETYDVLPYFRDEYKRRANGERYDKKVPETFEEFREFVKDEGKYQFWARCEYEIILADWPVQKTEKKIDVWDQIENNLDLVARLLKEDIENCAEDE